MPQLPQASAVASPTIQYLFLLSLGIAAGLYYSGLSKYWERSGRKAVVPRWRVAMYSLGVLAILVSLLSPLGTLNDQSFAAHMLQHLLMTLIAAPLILLGAPLTPLLWALPGAARRAVGRAFAEGSVLGWFVRQITRPLVALPLHTANLWLWHIPSAYEGAVNSGLLHDLQHASFFGTALLFWWPVVYPLPGRMGLPYPMRLVYLGVAMLVQSKVLGALLSFAGEPVYGVYRERLIALGLDPVFDQQLGGLLMLVVAAVMMFAAVTAVFFTWANRERA